MQEISGGSPEIPIKRWRARLRSRRKLAPPARVCTPGRHREGVIVLPCRIGPQTSMDGWGSGMLTGMHLTLAALLCPRAPPAPSPTTALRPAQLYECAWSEGQVRLLDQIMAEDHRQLDMVWQVRMCMSPLAGMRLRTCWPGPPAVRAAPPVACASAVAWPRP